MTTDKLVGTLSPKRLSVWKRITKEAQEGRISLAVESMLKEHAQSGMPSNQLTDMVDNIVFGGSMASEEAKKVDSLSSDGEGALPVASEVPTCEVFVVRHGERLDEVPGNDWRKQCGERWFDPPLTKQGIAQAAYAAAVLQSQLCGHADTPFDVIYCSPLQRCVSTAALFSQAFGAPIKLVPGLAEAAAAMKGSLYKERCSKLLSMEELTSLCPSATFCDPDPLVEKYIGKKGQTCLGRVGQNHSRILVVSHREAIRDLAELTGIQGRIRTPYACIAQFTCANPGRSGEKWKYNGCVHPGGNPPVVSSPSSNN